MKTIPYAAGVGCDVPLDSISNEDLFQFYANAKATFHHALGHNKSYRNEVLMKLYADELAQRDLVVHKSAAESGVFNGKGSY